MPVTRLDATPTGQLGTEQSASLLARRHRLRGADAVHLASALVLDTADLVVAVWDRRLHDGAVAEHLAVVPATLQRPANN